MNKPTADDLWKHLLKRIYDLILHLALVPLHRAARIPSSSATQMYTPWIKLQDNLLLPVAVVKQ